MDVNQYDLYLAKINQLLHKNNAVFIAHYYVPPILQDLAEATGGIVADSLALAEYGLKHPAKTIIIAGAYFMAETIKILNPNKRVLVPSVETYCSLAQGCPANEFADFWIKQISFCKFNQVVS